MAAAMLTLRPQSLDSRVICRINLPLSNPELLNAFLAAMSSAFSSMTSFTIDAAGHVMTHRPMHVETRQKMRWFAKGFLACQQLNPKGGRA